MNEIGEDERREFLVWYKSQKSEIFDNRSVLQKYTQDDVTVLRQACRVFGRHFVQIRKTDVFIDSIRFASARNKLLRKR